MRRIYSFATVTVFIGLAVLNASSPCLGRIPKTSHVSRVSGKTDNAADKELARLETVWNDAHVKGDVAALDKLWADDLIVTVPDMPIMNKTEALAVWKSGNFKFHSYKTSDIRIRVYGNTAVVTGQLERRRTNDPNEFEDDWRFTKVYVRRGGKWVVVAWHGSHVGTSN